MILNFHGFEFERVTLRQHNDLAWMWPSLHYIQKSPKFVQERKEAFEDIEEGRGRGMPGHGTLIHESICQIPHHQWCIGDNTPPLVGIQHLDSFFDSYETCHLVGIPLLQMCFLGWWDGAGPWWGSWKRDIGKVWRSSLRCFRCQILWLVATTLANRLHNHFF